MYNYDLHNAQANLYRNGSGYENVGYNTVTDNDYNTGVDNDWNVGANDYNTGVDNDWNTGYNTNYNTGYNRNLGANDWNKWTNQERIIPNDNKFLGYYVNYHKY